MAQQLGIGLMVTGKLRALVRFQRSGKSPDSVPLGPQERTGCCVVKGLKRRATTFKREALSVLSSAASAVTRAAAGLACCAVQPEVIETWEYNLDNMSAASSFVTAAPMQKEEALIPVGDDVAIAIVELRNAAVAAGKTVVTADELQAIKTNGAAKYQEHMSQLQANLAAADAAASKAAAGASLGGVGVCALGQQGFFGDLGSCDLGDLVEEEVAVCKVNQSSDVECLVDDCEGIAEGEWDALMADPAMAAIVAKLQAGIQAC